MTTWVIDGVIFIHLRLITPQNNFISILYHAIQTKTKLKILWVIMRNIDIQKKQKHYQGDANNKNTDFFFKAMGRPSNTISKVLHVT